MRVRIPILFTVLLLLFPVLPTRADVPLPPPAHYEVKCPSRQFVAALDPGTGVSVIGSSEVLWASTKWFRVAFLADDGEHFVTGYDGMNLIPRNFTKDLVLITFWKRNRQIREVTVGELFPDTDVLKKTASHYFWGGITGITNRTLSVTLCDGNVVNFDVTTGRIAR
jgi:hypothetical protein